MRTPDKESVKAAAAALSSTEDVTKIIKWITVLEPVVDAGIEFYLLNDAEFLMPMMELRRASLDKYVVVMKGIDAARQEMGLMGLTHRSSKSDYLREFMRTKRQRENRVLKLWNEMFSERDKLRGERRTEFMLRHAKRWNAERDARVEAMRKRLGRGVTMNEQRVVLDTLFEEIDAELDALEAFVREELRKPLSKRDPNGFKWRIGKFDE